MRVPRPLALLACAATFVAALGACAATPPSTSAGSSAATPAPSSNFGRENRVIDKDAVNGSTVFVSMRAPTIIDAGSGPFKISLKESEIVLTTAAEGQPFHEVTYIIRHEDDKSYQLQINSGEDLNDYIVQVSFKRLFIGKYTVEAYADDDLAPIGTGRFEVLEEGL